MRYRGLVVEAFNDVMTQLENGCRSMWTFYEPVPNSARQIPLGM